MALDEILGCLAHEAQVIAVGGLEGPSEREHQAREASIFSMCERIRASRLRGFDDAFRTAPLLLRARTAHRIRDTAAIPTVPPQRLRFVRADDQRPEDRSVRTEGLGDELLQLGRRFRVFPAGRETNLIAAHIPGVVPSGDAQKMVDPPFLEVTRDILGQKELRFHLAVMFRPEYAHKVSDVEKQIQVPGIEDRKSVV